MRPRPVSLALLIALAFMQQDRAHAQSLPPASQERRIDIAAYVRAASQRFGIPEGWIYAVIRVESGGRTRAISSAGAMGLMQLMPGTWARQRARFALGGDPFDPRDNIMAGTSYLCEMYDRYGAPGFLAAYNAGPGRYEAWRDRGRPLPLETRRYVARLAPMLQSGRMIAGADLQVEDRQLAFSNRPGEVIPEIAGHASDRSQAHRFARPAMPEHDLFVPVATGDPR